MVDGRNVRGHAQPCKNIYNFWSNLTNLRFFHVSLTKTIDLEHPKSEKRGVFTTINDAMIRTGREERIVRK